MLFQMVNQTTSKSTIYWKKGDKVDKEVKKNAINESEGIMGQLTFQVRMIQEDNSKEINLKAFAYHDWAEPANPPAKKEWGMLEMHMLTQSSYCILGGKFQKRKIEFFLNVSYLQKHLSGETWGKLINTQGATNWKGEEEFNEQVQASLQQKRALKIRGLEMLLGNQPGTRSHTPQNPEPEGIRELLTGKKM